MAGQTFTVRRHPASRRLYWFAVAGAAFAASVLLLSGLWRAALVFLAAALPMCIWLRRFAYVWRLEVEPESFTWVGLSGARRRYAYSDVREAALSPEGDRYLLVLSDGRKLAVQLTVPEGGRFCRLLRQQGVQAAEGLESALGKGGPSRFSVRMPGWHAVAGLIFLSFGLAVCIGTGISAGGRTDAALLMAIALPVGGSFGLLGAVLILGVWRYRFLVDARERAFRFTPLLGRTREYALSQVESYQIRRLDAPYAHTTAVILRLAGKKYDFDLNGRGGTRFLALLKDCGVAEYDEEKQLPPPDETDWFGGRLRRPKRAVAVNVIALGPFLALGIGAVAYGILREYPEAVLAGSLSALFGGGALAGFFFAATHIDSHPKLAEFWLGKGNIRRKKS